LAAASYAAAMSLALIRSMPDEVIDYNKLLSDAKKRNGIFFDKINLMNSNT
jgi:hypothetical protein